MVALRLGKDTGSKSSDQELWNEFILNLNPLYTIGVILLRHKSIKPFNNFEELPGAIHNPQNAH